MDSTRVSSPRWSSQSTKTRTPTRIPSTRFAVFSVVDVVVPSSFIPLLLRHRVRLRQYGARLFLANRYQTTFSFRRTPLGFNILFLLVPRTHLLFIFKLRFSIRTVVTGWICFFLFFSPMIFLTRTSRLVYASWRLCDWASPSRMFRVKGMETDIVS